jgi:hypothetical protein
MPFSLSLGKGESLKRRPAVGRYQLEHTPYLSKAYHPNELVVEDFVTNFLENAVPAKFAKLTSTHSAA